ncbi:hypothetical protein P4O66_015818 [Electrophorus voltai]|uniref:Ras-associating domain-containing protein n=1 Tax=Electrophorus voltai TaxID=2609070 RepID=A0AAD8YWZ6_9TELE|nr:hypothetical protein P4O66_015818 [Electrophorus voltai]
MLLLFVYWPRACWRNESAELQALCLTARARMELKVWVDGVQRVVCGVTEATTCQEVVIALAQAIGRTGRYTLIEKWRDTERHLAPLESPVASLNTWERGLHRQSLPIMAKLRAPGEHSLRRREPRRKSLTFTGGPRSLRDILSGSRLSDAGTKRRVLLRDTLAVLGHRAEEREAELQAWAEKGQDGAAAEASWVTVTEEVAHLEQQVRRNQVEVEEEEFWASELQIERESERQLEERLQELCSRLRACEAELDQRLACLQGVEAGLVAQRLQKEMRETQKVSEGEVKARLQRVKAELKAQAQHTAQLDSSSRAVDRSLSQTSRRLQESQYELEQLTKELRQVNLQQFIQQTGTKVTVLPVEPSEGEASPTPHNTDVAALTGSLKRPVPSNTVGVNLRMLHSPTASTFNPEGIYV